MGCAGGEGARTSLLAMYPTKGCVNILVGRSDINCATAFTACYSGCNSESNYPHILAFERGRAGRNKQSFLHSTLKILSNYYECNYYIALPGFNT